MFFRTGLLFLRTPRSAAFAASFVDTDSDKARDKARDKDLGSPRKIWRHARNPD